MTPILDHLLTAPTEPAPMDSLETWWREHQRWARFPRPVDRAMAGGFSAERPGYAFASGFHETLQQLQGRADDGLTAFCATEEGGAHPRAVQTTLSSVDGVLLLNGQKTFVTLGTFVQSLLVVAKRGERDGRPELVVVQIDAGRKGVHREALPTLGLVPEIPHAALRFEGVVVAPAEVLPGDGYLRYVKPMRTVEDGHLLAALLAWVLQVARHHRWPTAVLEDLVAILAALRTVAAMDPLAPAAHVTLAGVQRQATERLEATDSHWERVDPITTKRWRRDRALLEIASTARQRRIEAAWRSLG